jgi:hypothetical protein
MTNTLLQLRPHWLNIMAVMLVSLHLSLFASGQTFPREANDAVSAEVENIYQRALIYLAKTQSPDGTWSSNSAAGTGVRPGAVAFGILAFLAHGDDPNYGPYAGNIQKSLNYLIRKSQERPDGYMGPQMYDHGFATLALAECYGMVDDRRIAPALSKSVELILKAQKNNPRNGWRYNPDSKDADSTVSGCQLVALLAARNAGIPVPDEAIDKGLGYMKTCHNSSGAYGYTSRASSRVTLTAIGSLCYALAKKKNESSYPKSTEYLVKNLKSQGEKWPFYHRYYMAQALFQADEPSWEKWNKDNTRLLSAAQLPDGSFAGTYGNAYSTAAACRSLALNYRFLPIYEK